MGSNFPPQRTPFDDLVDDMHRVGQVVNGQRAGITAQSDVIERTMLDMAGVKTVPSALHMVESKKTPSTFFMDVQGLSAEEASKFVDTMNGRYGAGTVNDTGAWKTKTGTKYDNSFQIDIEKTRTQILPDLDKHLDQMGRDNPGYIRGLQTQSGASPDYKGAGEERTPVPLKVPGKQGFNDITPQIEAKKLAQAAGIGAPQEASGVDAPTVATGQSQEKSGVQVV